MEVQIFEFNPFGEHTFVIYDEVSRDAIVIDPGMMQQREVEAFDKLIADNKLKIRYLLNTHLHVDHVASDLYVKNKYGVELSASLDDKPLASRVAEQARMFHLSVDLPNKIEIDNPLKDGDRLSLAGCEINVIAVPGHSPGSLAFYFPSEGFVIVGDALFKLSIGRTDLPGGDHRQLVESIQQKLLTLPEETVVMPGHGPSTTIANELRYNPFIR